MQSGPSHRNISAATLPGSISMCGHRTAQSCRCNMLSDEWVGKKARASSTIALTINAGGHTGPPHYYRRRSHRTKQSSRRVWNWVNNTDHQPASPWPSWVRRKSVTLASRPETPTKALNKLRAQRGSCNDPQLLATHGASTLALPVAHAREPPTVSHAHMHAVALCLPTVHRSLRSIDEPGTLKQSL